MKNRFFLLGCAIILYPILLLIGLLILAYFLIFPIWVFINPNTFITNTKFDKVDSI